MIETPPTVCGLQRENECVCVCVCCCEVVPGSSCDREECEV